MTDSMYTAGRKLKEIRIKSGLSLRELAKRTNFSPSYVSYIENGEKRGSIDFFQKCADVLNISIADLLEAEDIPLPKELRKEGVDWILFGKELERKGITMDDIKGWVNDYKKGK